MAYSHRITPEMVNFSRLAMCIIGPGTQMMRDILSVKVKPSSLRNLVSYSNLKLNHEQKLQLNTGADPDYANFDISFIYLLLRTPGMCRPPIPAPTNGWSFPPSSKIQLTLGDDIERLRILKNHICSHIKKPELSKNEFDDKIAELKEVAIRIDNFLAQSTDYVKEICDMETENMENEVCDYFIEQIKELKQREHDFDEKIRNVEEKTDQMNIKLNKAVETMETFSREAEAQKEQEDAFLKQIQTDDYIFVESNVSKSTLSSLKKTKVIFIIGITGQGKTALSRHVAIHFLNNGYKIFNIRSAEEFKRKCNPNKRAIYLMDDIFGKHYKIQYEVDSWLRNIDDVSQWSQNYDMYLIGTSQKIVWNECQPYIRTCELFQTENILDLTSDRMKLEPHEKRVMLQNHLMFQNRNFTEMMMQEIIQIKTPIGFPYCCSSFSSNDELYAIGAEYFWNTKTSLMKEFERLSEIDTEKFCVLLSVMVLGNSFPIDFEQIIENGIGNKVGSILQPYGIELNKNVVKLNTALKKLKGVYLQEQNCYVSFIHDAYIDAMCMVSSNRHIDVILQNCSADFFHQYIRIYGRSINDDTCIFKTDANEDLFKCIIRLLKNGELHLVFENPMFEDETFIDKLKGWVRQEPELFEFMTCPLNNEENKPSVIEYCLDSKKEPLVRFAIFFFKHFQTVSDLCPDTLTTCINECLCIACRNGLLEAVEELLCMGANVAYRSPKSHNLDPVLWSAAFGQIDILLLLAERGANIGSVDSKMRTASDYLIRYYLGDKEPNDEAENIIDRLTKKCYITDLLCLLPEKIIKRLGSKTIFDLFSYNNAKLQDIIGINTTHTEILTTMFTWTIDVLKNRGNVICVVKNTIFCMFLPWNQRKRECLNRNFLQISLPKDIAENAADRIMFKMDFEDYLRIFREKLGVFEILKCFSPNNLIYSGDSYQHTIASKNIINPFLELAIKRVGVDVTLKLFPADYVYYDGKTILHLINEMSITDHSFLKSTFRWTEYLLFFSDVDVNKQDSRGKTPIIYAAQRANPYTLCLLCSDERADVNITDHEGKTALHHLMITWNESVIDSFELFDALYISKFIDRNFLFGTLRLRLFKYFEFSESFLSDKLCLNAASSFFLLASNAKIFAEGQTKDPIEYLSTSEKKRLYTLVNDEAKKFWHLWTQRQI